MESEGMSAEPTISTVQSDDFTITSTHESADDMLKSLRPDEGRDGADRKLVDKGKRVAAKDASPDPVSEAAAELGKRGGEAAAKARAKQAEEKQARGSDDEDEEEAPAKQGDEDEEPEAAEAKDARGNPRHDPKARIAELARERKEARERAEAAERRAAEAERRAAEYERQRQAAPAERPQEAQQRQERPEKPRAEDYESYEEYLDARDAHNRQEWTRDLARKAEAHAYAAQQAQEVDGIVKRVRDMGDKIEPEHREKVAPVLQAIGAPSRLVDGPTTAENWIADVLVSAGDKAPGLLLYLSEHPSDLQRLRTLQKPHDVSWALAEIAVSLNRSDAATGGSSSEREVSQARTPVRPLTGSPRTGDDLPDDGDDYDTHYRKMQALDKKRRAR